MRVGVISDAHGNLEAFEACLAAMGRVDLLLFGGDLLGYYFDGPLILRRLRELNAICIAGNHDLYFLAHGGRELHYQLPVPPPEVYRQRYGPSLERARDELTIDEVEFLATLPCERSLELDGHRVLMVHGSPFRPADEYVYPDYPSFGLFDQVDAELVILGHTHRPFIRRQPTIALLNSGSCGQPRDGDPRASFAMVELSATGVDCSVHRVAYDRMPLLKRCRELAPGVNLLTELLLREKSG